MQQGPTLENWQQILGAMRISTEARKQLMVVRRTCLQRLGEVYRARERLVQELAASLPAATSGQADQGERL